MQTVKKIEREQKLSVIMYLKIESADIHARTSCLQEMESERGRDE